MLKIHNSFSKQKEIFKPIEPGKVRMYVCGMTVYDLCHLGHVRVMVVFDMVVRYLRHSGYKVTYVRNVTDIDDKIIKRANENGESITQLTERFMTMPPGKRPYPLPSGLQVWPLTCVRTGRPVSGRARRAATAGRGRRSRGRR